MEAKQQLDEANSVLGTVIATISPDQWETNVPTTAKWNVRQLVNHVSQTNRNITTTLQGNTPVNEATNLDNPDPVNNWGTSLDELTGVLLTFSEYDKPILSPAGEVPATTFLTMMIGDRLAHAWDIAGAIGTESRLPDALVDTAYSLWKEVAPSIKRSSEGVGPVIDVPADASTQDKLLALTGRDPHVNT
jgi:uncharacterized protein (TIGR03086 family)